MQMSDIILYKFDAIWKLLHNKSWIDIYPYYLFTKFIYKCKTFYIHS